MKYYKRRQFARSIWNISFLAAATVFLYFYNEFMIIPSLELGTNTGRLFPTYEHIIFFKGQSCDQIKPHTLLIITFYLHGAILDARESDYTEGASKICFFMAMTAVNGFRYENYFVGFNIIVGVYLILAELLFILALQTTKHKNLIYQVYLGLKIASWAHVFISLIPFKYLVPTLFAKNFKLSLNVAIWLWYGLTIWNSPILQFFNHQIYHATPMDCLGEGSAAKCILLRDSSEYRHYKTLRKAYFEVKLAHDKIMNVLPATSNANAATKTFKTLRAFMTLKRKVKRIREGKADSSDFSNDVDEEDVDE